MRSRFFGITAIAFVLGGCAMTQHSNMMVFGTNTSVALSVGGSATSTPEIVVGYKRQEAVLMPLLANTYATTGTNGETKLWPCPDVKTAPTTADEQAALANCKFVGVANGRELDSYSVLASFGAKFDAKGAPNASASGGLAQYFATGLAARILAQRAGAAAVATGDAAYANSALIASDDMRARIDAITPQDVADSVARINQSKEKVASLIEQSGPNLPAQLKAIDARFGKLTRFAAYCNGVDAAGCAQKLRTVNLFDPKERLSILSEEDWKRAGDTGAVK